MRIGLCGGTYDPLHRGHEALMRAALASGLVDRLLVMPAGQPPHKKDRPVSFARYRYDMARCTFADEPRITVSDYEIRKDSPSYTLDTARWHQDQHPDQQLFLVYGSDVLAQIPSWHQPLALLAAWPLLIADRGGFEQAQSRQAAAALTAQTGASIRFFKAPSLDLSATQIRRQAARGQVLADQLPACVAAYVAHNGLYRWQAAFEALDRQLWHDLMDLERDLWSLLSPDRLIHSLNVVHYALHLASCHQVPARPVALAALLHDCAKSLPLDQQKQLAARSGEEHLREKALIHGPAGSVLARERFGIDDPQVLQAICRHTTGHPQMSAVERIVFIADKAEPARRYPDLAAIRQCAEQDLLVASRLTFQGIAAGLARKGLQAHPYTRAGLDRLNQRPQGKSRPKPPEPV